LPEAGVSGRDLAALSGEVAANPPRYRQRDPGGAVMSYEYFATHDYDDN
jgi:hypothetical protein